MRIGLSGTHGTGKTTLLNDLLSTGYFDGYANRSGGSRWVHSLGLPINKEGNDAGQILIALNQVRNLWSFDKMISDRTLLDVLVYTDIQYHEGKVSYETYLMIDDLLCDAIDKKSYRHIFYIRPFGEPADDGLRSQDLGYHDKTFKTFERLINNFGLMQKDFFHIIEGTREERVRQVLSHTHNLKKGEYEFRAGVNFTTYHR